MRTNIYAEELTAETEVVTKEANERRFYGVRFFLASPIELHHREGDDDRSAVTLWVPWTQDDGYDFSLVRNLLTNLMLELINAEAMEHEATR